MVPLSSSLGLNCSDREHVGLWRRTEAMAYLPVYLAHGVGGVEEGCCFLCFLSARGGISS